MHVSFERIGSDVIHHGEYNVLVAQLSEFIEDFWPCCVGFLKVLCNDFLVHEELSYFRHVEVPIVCSPT